MHNLWNGYGINEFTSLSPSRVTYFLTLLLNKDHIPMFVGLNITIHILSAVLLLILLYLDIIDFIWMELCKNVT